jgi:protein TonB
MRNLVWQMAAACLLASAALVAEASAAVPAQGGVPDLYKPGESAGITSPRPDGPHSFPTYPFEAMRLLEEGDTLLSFTIREDGTVADPKVETSSGFPILDNAALDGVKVWRYVPAQRGGHPIAVRTRVDIRFRLAGYDAPGRPFDIVQMESSDFPSGALAAGEAGDTWIMLTVDENGSITGIQILRSSGSPRLDQAAMARATGGWHFTPAKRDGKAIRTILMLDVHWPAQSAPPQTPSL